MKPVFHSLKVKSIVPETADAVVVSFEIPEDLQSAYLFKPGQHVTLRFELNGQEYRRSYSMCNRPVAGELSICVKRVEFGVVSNYIADKLKVGDEVEVMTPEGRFVCEANPDNKKNYYLFAAGSGITPLMSIAKTLLEEERMSYVFLLYGNRNENSIIFKEELDRMAKEYDGQFYVKHSLSQPLREKKGGLGGLFSKGKITWTGDTGRIDTAKVRQFITEDFPPRHKISEYYICGPGNFIQTVESALLENGVDKQHIHHEYFTNPDQETKANPPSAEKVDGAKVIVTLDKQQFEVSVPAGKSILDVLLDQGIDAPYSCTSGACATCMAKVTKGAVSMDTCFALDDSEVKNGYILTCQAHPTTETVELTFDI
ncbi:MAG: nitric oxide dioxygenase [Saprospirales bacterium]|nr:nitric oxide dioxygenase [Saprospirales bacterium]